MKTIIYKSIYLLSLIFLISVGSCTDDFPTVDGIIPDGEGGVSATVTFTPVTATNLGTTRTPGNELNDIESLCVLVYGTDNNLIKKYTVADLVNYDVSKTYTVDKDKDHLDGSEAHTDESTTAQATFKLNDLPYGRYYIYAVANMGDLSDPKYSDAIQTVEGLKNISLIWNPEDIALNNQMFGYFTPYNDMESKGFDAPLLVFRDKTQDLKIHAWLKRAASKVTVQFDPSGLNQGVKIYIRNVTIRDIPKTCLLGAENTPSSIDELDNHVQTPYPAPDYKTNPTEAIKNSRFEYNSNGIILNQNDHTGDAKTDGLRLDNSIRSAVPADAHATDAPSLFFFENNQNNYLEKRDPDYKNKSIYDKQQKPSDDKNGDGVGTPVRDEKDEDGKLTDLKDKVPFGTYIEVEAYYISDNPANMGEGTIKYRFMLGKDSSFDYDAQRNYHFKVTLGFKGWANDPDWHIDYELPSPGLEVPPTFRVSYLYGQMSELPIRILGNLRWLTVSITENNWAPYDPTSTNQWKVPDDIIETSPAMYQFQWNYSAFTNPEYMTTNISKPEFGFLALHLPNRNTTAISRGYSNEANEELITYYHNNLEGERRFDNSDMSIGIHDSSYGDRNNNVGYRATNDDEYKVYANYNDAGVALPNQRTLMLPVWTRAKTLISESGFSGNNPYEGFERKAKLKIAAIFEDGTPDGKRIEEEVDVFQVKRLVNPKGVWRDAGRNETFNVTLLEAINSNAMSDFQPFKSDGEWTAYIDGTTNGAGFSLRPNGDTNGFMTGDTIHGYTGSTINFAINFGAAVKDDESECAIVKVLYHGNQCLHKILIRKGYAAPVTMGGKTWSSYSLYQANPRPGGVDGYSDTYDAILTKNPLMLGSMFRRGIQSMGIRVKSNQDIGFLQPPNGAAFQVASSRYTTRTWSQIDFRDDVTNASNRDRGLGTFYADGRTYKVPTFDDWQALTDEAEFGFGVVYGSAANGPALTAEDAYGLIDPDNEGLFDDPRGMRGIIAYNKTTGDQIFFPVGKYGTGRRTMFNIQNATYNGVLRYSDVYNPLSISNSANNLYRPIPYNLPIASGNVYWTDVFVDNVRESSNVYGRGCLGWDLNYFNFDFNAYTANNYRDACPIKFIIVE